jgi:transposase
VESVAVERRSFSLRQRERALAAAAAPGAKVAEVARRHGICPSLLYRWRRQSEGREPRRAADRPGFVLLRVDVGSRCDGSAGAAPGVPVAAAAEMTQVEVVLRNGRVLRVGAGVDAALVARLAGVLEA